MAFSKYLLEIKNRLFLLIFTGLSSFIAGYAYKETLLFLLIQPPNLFKKSDLEPAFYFIFTDITEIFLVYIKLLTFLSAQVLLFNLIYQVFLFFSPALYRKEYYNLRFVLFLIVFALWVSILLLTQLLVPLTWNFFLSFQSLNFVNLHFEAKLSEYLNFYMYLYYICLLYCQMFAVFLLFLHHLNADVLRIRKLRKLSYFFLILFSTLISPPDVLSQLLISGCLGITCEILLIISIYKAILSKFN